jgi:hypothetical protein
MDVNERKLFQGMIERRNEGRPINICESARNNWDRHRKDVGAISNRLHPDSILRGLNNGRHEEFGVHT